MSRHPSLTTSLQDEEIFDNPTQALGCFEAADGKAVVRIFKDGEPMSGKQLLEEARAETPKVDNARKEAREK